MSRYVEETPLWNDINKVFNAKGPNYTFDYQALLHTIEEDISILKLLSIDYKRDYVNKVGDEVLIKFLIPFGIYVNHIYPKRHNLELTIKRVSKVGDGYYNNLEEKADIERYKAIFIDSMNMNVQLGFAHYIDTFTLNNRPPAEVTLQLINRTLEPLRVKTVWGVFNNVKRDDFIRAIVGGETSKILVDGKPGIDALDIYDIDNKENIKQIVIPNNTPVTTIPTFIQEKHTGLYTSGVGSYFQKYKDKRTWFIYPLFDIVRFDNAKDKAIIYSVSKQRFGGMPRTYLLEDNTLHIITTGEHRYVDDGETTQMRNGVGFRQTNADLIMKKPVQMTKEGPVGIRTRLNTEVGMKKREDNLNFASVSSRGIANNNMAEYSRYLINNGARVDLIWKQADPNLIFPGMPCQYIYYDGEVTKKVRGVILNVHTLVTTGNSQGIRVTDSIYSTSCAVTLFVEKFYEQGKANYSAFGEGYDAVFNKDILELGEKTDWLEDIYDGFLDGVNNTIDMIFKGIDPSTKTNSTSMTPYTGPNDIRDDDKLLDGTNFKTFILVKRHDYFSQSDVVEGGVKFINNGFTCNLPQTFKSEGERMYFLIVDRAYFSASEFLFKEGISYRLVISYPLSTTSFINIKNGKSADSTDITNITNIVKRVNSVVRMIDFNPFEFPGTTLNYIMNDHGPDGFYNV